jgi:UDP-N-acetylmuramyl pentapeptide phosphotransferase/UDP-N-acetylglucosamine-1-phosphate transferase
MFVVTRSFHGNFTLDNRPGVQKLHTAPTPRIGGLALLVGAVVGGAFLASGSQRLRWLICISAVPAFRTGLLEDVTKGVSVKMRLLATIFAAMVFCTLTGYWITSVDIIGIDGQLSSWVPSFVFTAFAIGGIANAMNIIDGVNGLSSGMSIIILTGFAVVAGQGW